MRVVFGTNEDYLRQIARLDLLIDASSDPTRPLREVNLALGSQVPVAYGTAAPTLGRPGAAPPGARRPSVPRSRSPPSPTCTQTRIVSFKTTFIGAVEIGTSKIVALVGEYTGREIVIIGCGECASRGVIKGSVVDYRAATECTQSALELAERDANERIDHVYLSQTGGPP